MKLYCYAKPNQMVEHRFTDDVAICKADNKNHAVEIFRRIYTISDEDAEKYVKEVWFNNYKTAVLTDY